MSGEPSSIGPYEIRGELGRGAMAVVWRAFDPKLEREVAIKEPVIPHGTAPEVAAELAERFVREGKAVAQLSHPGIVTVFDAGVFDGRPAIVMELIEGSTLTDILGQPMEATAAIALADQLLDALGYAHARSIVHRDVKPDNVFVTREGRVKLADFGIARVGDATVKTQAGTVLGTPGYMAPEQVRGLEADNRADIFAVGAILYEALTGSNPFGATDGVDPTSIMYRIVHEQPEPPEVLVPQLPGWIGQVLAVAMAKDAAQRYPSADVMRADLRAQSASLKVPVAAGPAGHRPSKAGWLVAAVALVGFVGLGAAFMFARGATTGAGGATAPAPASATAPVPAAPEQYAIAAFRGTDLWIQDESGQREAKLTQRGAEELGNFSSEGYLTDLFYDASSQSFRFQGGSEGYQSIWNCDLDGNASRTWSNEGADGEFMFDQSIAALEVDAGGRLVALGTDGVLHDATGGAVGESFGSLVDTNPSLDLGADGSPYFRALAYAPSGSALAFAAYSSNYEGEMGYVGAADGSGATMMGSGTSDSAPKVSDLAWSPDSKRIVAVSEERALVLFDAEGNVVRNLWQPAGESRVGAPAYSPDGSRIAFNVDETLWVIGADGSDPHEIGIGYSPAWVPAEAAEKAFSTSGG